MMPGLVGLDATLIDADQGFGYRMKHAPARWDVKAAAAGLWWLPLSLRLEPEVHPELGRATARENDRSRSRLA